MTDNRNNGRDTAGRFTSGNRGRPKGARHKTTLALEALLDGEAEEITRKVIQKAKEGDMAALKLVLARILPPLKDRALAIDLPEVRGSAGVLEALSQVTRAAASGELTLPEAVGLAHLVEQYRKTYELEDIERRIEELENCGA